MNEYDFDGDMSYFQEQLERAGITKEQFNMDDYAGLTFYELQGIVDSILKIINVKKVV